MHATAEPNAWSSVKDVSKSTSIEDLRGTGSKCQPLLITSCTQSRYISLSRKKVDMLTPKLSQLGMGDRGEEGLATIPAISYGERKCTVQPGRRPAVKAK